MYMYDTPATAASVGVPSGHMYPPRKHAATPLLPHTVGSGSTGLFPNATAAPFIPAFMKNRAAEMLVDTSSALPNGYLYPVETRNGVYFEAIDPKMAVRMAAAAAAAAAVVVAARTLSTVTAASTITIHAAIT